MEIEELIRVWTLGMILALFKPNNQEKYIILNIFRFSVPCTVLEYLSDLINLQMQNDGNVAYMQ